MSARRAPLGTLSGAFLLGLLYSGAPVSAQLVEPAPPTVPVDSVALLVEAWTEVLGWDGLEHPAGRVHRVCLRREPAGWSDHAVGFGALPAETQRGFIDHLESTGRLTLTMECQLDEESDTPVRWVVDGRGRPAVSVRLEHFHVTHDRAVIGWWSIRGERMGRFDECTFDLDLHAGVWNLRGCEVKMEF